MRSNKYPGRKRKLFASTMLILRLLFGGLQSASASSNSKTFQSGVNSKTEISRTLNQQSSMINNFNPEGSTQPELVPEDSQLLLTLGLPRGGEWQPKFGPGPRAKADARKATANRARNSKAGNSQSGISPFAQAFTVEPKFPARPGQNRDGLFGRFSARPTPDPSNPGCAGGPRSITVLSGQRNSDSSKKLTAYDGFEAKLTAKSENHLTSKHGHKFGVDDPLPRNPNQKPTKYEQTRTRLNNENKAKVREEIKSILSNTNSDIYHDVSIRGIQGRVYHSKDTNHVVGIHTEGEFAGLIMKAQPISDPQLDLLRELNILDKLLNYLPMNDQQNFFKLLKYSNKLKRNNKYLGKQDPEAFDTLLKFLVIIAENFHHSEKHEYINLAKDFLADQITADDFSYAFMGIYEGIGEKLNQMKIEESVELANFINKTDRYGLNRLLARIYGSCDSFSPDPEVAMSDEKELKDYAQILLFKLQEE